MRPDFLVTSPTYKWLLGTYNLDFLYVGEAYRKKGEPTEHAWLSRCGSEDFSWLVDYEEAFQAGARCFDVGETSNFVLLPMAIAALRQILDWGVANLAKTLDILTARVEVEARNLGMEAVPVKKRAGHMIEENVFVSVQSQALRVAPPNLYSTK